MMERGEEDIQGKSYETLLRLEIMSLLSLIYSLIALCCIMIKHLVFY